MPFSRHLNAEQLVAAGEGAADEKSRAHLVGCERCSLEAAPYARLLNLMATDELETPSRAATASLIALLPAAAPLPSLAQRLQAVLRLDSGMGALAYGLRGAGKGRQLLYDAGDYEIDLRLRPEGQGWCLLGQLLGEDAESGRVQVSDERAAYHGAFNELGEFEVRDVPPGTYVLLLSLPDAEVEIRDLLLE